MYAVLDTAMRVGAPPQHTASTSDEMFYVNVFYVIQFIERLLQRVAVIVVVIVVYFSIFEKSDEEHE